MSETLPETRDTPHVVLDPKKLVEHIREADHAAKHIPLDPELHQCVELDCRRLLFEYFMREKTGELHD